MRIRHRSVFLLALPLLAAAPNVGAQQYVGISVGSVDFGDLPTRASFRAEFSTATISTLIPDIATTAIVARYGIQLSDFFSGEVRYGLAMTDDTFSDEIINVSAELDSMYGVYGRYILPLDDAISWYVVLGYSFVEATVSLTPRDATFSPLRGFAGSTSTTTSDWSSVSFGFGTDWRFHRWWVANFEYTGYVRQQNLYIDGLSLGIVRRLR